MPCTFPEDAASTAITSRLDTDGIAYPHSYFLPSKPETNVKDLLTALTGHQLRVLLELLLFPWPNQGAQSATVTESAVNAGHLHVPHIGIGWATTVCGALTAARKVPRTRWPR
ncbi:MULTISPECIES: hypothetical protein [Streptomyces]|uniref:hypothetical protein n=1 Tax=Streptomyces TaxID=1883 RepID=UPI00331AA35C